MTFLVRSTTTRKSHSNECLKKIAEYFSATDHYNIKLIGANRAIIFWPCGEVSARRATVEEERLWFNGMLKRNSQ